MYCDWLFLFFFFFFNDTATTEIYTLSLHDALPIFAGLNESIKRMVPLDGRHRMRPEALQQAVESDRSEEHTSELQSRQYLVCRLLLEKKKKQGLSILEVGEVVLDKHNILHIVCILR